jgi:hypothetical protein
MIPALFKGLFDDASTFPPGNLPVTEAVPAHRAHRAAWYAEAVGPLLLAGGRLAELPVLDGPLRAAIILPGGPAQLEAALAAADGLELAGVEVAAEDVVETMAALDKHLSPEVPAALELARGKGLEEKLDLLAGTRYRAKFRTGGVTAEAFPSVDELAVFLTGCAERGIAYKCTAGLHNAVRHTDPETGFEHHGFLNVLLAAMSGDRAIAADVLAERNGAVLAGVAKDLTDGQVAFIRDAFTAFGTCSIAEPLADLAELGLLTPPSNLEDR